MRHALLPTMAWRPGGPAAGLRYAAITVLATLLAQCRIPIDELVQLADDDRCISLLAQVAVCHSQ